MKEYENFTIVTMTNTNASLKTAAFKKGINIEFYPGNNHSSDSIAIYDDETSQVAGRVEINEKVIQFTIIYNNDAITKSKEFKISTYAETINSTQIAINFGKLTSDIYNFLVKCFDWNTQVSTSDELKTQKKG